VGPQLVEPETLLFLPLPGQYCRYASDALPRLRGDKVPPGIFYAHPSAGLSFYSLPTRPGLDEIAAARENERGKTRRRHVAISSVHLDLAEAFIRINVRRNCSLASFLNHSFTCFPPSPPRSLSLSLSLSLTRTPLLFLN
jgi:hypothetical protein